LENKGTIWEELELTNREFTISIENQTIANSHLGYFIWVNWKLVYWDWRSLTYYLSGSGVNYIAKQVIIFLGEEDLVFVGLGTEIYSSNSQYCSSVNTSKLRRKWFDSQAILELIRSGSERGVDKVVSVSFRKKFYSISANETSWEYSGDWSVINFENGDVVSFIDSD